MKKQGLREILFISIAIMLIISSTALIHPNEAEFIIDRFEGITAFSFSLFDSLLYAAYLIFGLIAGYLGARTGLRKTFIIIGAAGVSIITLLMPVVDKYSVLLCLRFFQGIFSVTAWQTLMTLILDLSDNTNRGRNMGFFGIFMSLAMGLSPVIGGILANISVFTPYYVASIQCAIAVLVTIFLISDPPVRTRNIKPSLIQSFMFARKRMKLVIPALFNFVDRLHMGFIIFMVPLMLREVLKLGPEYRGMLLGINGLAFIILQYPIGRLSDRIGRFKLLTIGSIGYGILLCLTGPAAGVGLSLLIVLFFFLGIFSGFTGPPNSALVGDIVAADENSLAMGFFNFFGNLGMVFGALLGGVMLSVSDFTAAFLIAGLIELGTLAINLLILRKMKSREKVTEAEFV